MLQERGWCQTAFRLVPLRQERNGGPAAARNRGSPRPGPVIAFTDDDCIPQPGWCRPTSTGWRAGRTSCRARPCRCPTSGDRWNPFCRSYTRTRDGGFYETCNMAYRREVLDAVDGFDEGFRFPYGEDTDLAWRAIENGSSVQFCREAEVYHEVWTFAWPAYLADLRRREGMVQLVVKHPDLRALFPGWYEHRRHTAALQTTASLLALAARPKSPLRWAAVGGTIAQLLVGVRSTGRPRPPRPPLGRPTCRSRSPADLAEVGVMAAYSAKYRTRLL